MLKYAKFNFNTFIFQFNPLHPALLKHIEICIPQQKYVCKAIKNLRYDNERLLNGCESINKHIIKFFYKLHIIYKRIKMYILIPKNNGMILSLSSVTNPGRCWYFCATPECTSDNRKNMNYNLLQNAQFHANSHTCTRKQAQQHHSPSHTPSHIPLSWRYFFNCGTCKQIYSSNVIFHFNGICVLILTCFNER